MTADPPTAALDTTPAPATPDLRPAPVPPKSAPAALNRRTGEPRRPWTIWLASSLLLASSLAAVVGLAWAMWDLASPFVLRGEEYVKEDRFAVATWLSGRWVTEPGSAARVALAVAVTLIGFLVAAASATVAFYAFRGYRWTRIGGLVALGVSLGTLTLNLPSWVAIGLAAAGAAPLWLPPTKGYFDRWAAQRNPAVSFAEPLTDVFYGPLPRFR